MFLKYLLSIRKEMDAMPTGYPGTREAPINSRSITGGPIPPPSRNAGR
jgi:hypothetical protein